MGRKVKNPRQDRRRRFLFRPALAGWQKWEEDSQGAWLQTGESLELSDLGPVAGSIIAVPVRRAFSLAVWVPAEDPSLFEDLVFTQLELRGLAGRSREGTSFFWQEIASEGDQALLHAVVFPGHLAPRYWHGDVTQYAVSPACLPLPPDEVSVWEEEGGWVAAVTRGERLLHFQALATKAPSADMALEVWLLLAPLEAGKMLSGGGSVRLFYQGAEPPDLGDWRAAGGLPVEAVPFPPPVRPKEPDTGMPIPVREVQKAKEVSARRQKLALVAAAAYFVIVLALAANTLRLWWKADALSATLAAEEPEVTAVRSAMDRWNSLEPALNPGGYPLEVLYQTARLLPEDGVRLTIFQMGLDRVVIAGEASTLTAAQRFQEELRKNPDLIDFEWRADNPKMMPTGSARFQIDGLRHGTASSTGREDDDEGFDG